MIEPARAHFGFTRIPFGRNLAPAMLYRHHAHQEAVARIEWAIAAKAIAVVTGEVGAGKTVAVRAATATLDASRNTVVYIGNPTIGGTGIYATIAHALGATPRFRRAELIAQTQDLLTTEQDERGRSTVLIIDEGHLLTGLQLDELRMLTNTEMDSASPLATLLIGQPTLRRKIRLGEYAALDQRIAFRCELTGMDLKETSAYIRHHTKIAGRDDTLFTADAVALIHHASRGLPRQVNNLAIAALTSAYFKSGGTVDEKDARAAIAEVIQAPERHPASP